MCIIQKFVPLTFSFSSPSVVQSSPWGATEMSISLWAPLDYDCEVGKPNVAARECLYNDCWQQVTWCWVCTLSNRCSSTSLQFFLSLPSPIHCFPRRLKKFSSSLSAELARLPTYVTLLTSALDWLHFAFSLSLSQLRELSLYLNWIFCFLSVSLFVDIVSNYAIWRLCATNTSRGRN